jgi:hypothetical protein
MMVNNDSCITVGLIPSLMVKNKLLPSGYEKHTVDERSPAPVDTVGGFCHYS